MSGHDPRAQLLAAAAAFQRAGRLEEAAAAYEHLLAKWPDLPNAWYNLGFVRRHLGRFEAALAAYRQALDRGAHEPEEIHLNRAVIYADHLRNDEAAEAELKAALARNERYAPALLNLANLKEDRGDRSAALEIYERLLTVDPSAHEALARYASLKMPTDQNDPLLVRLREAMANPRATPAERSSLGFALGKCLDANGAYDAAFDAYAAANRLSRASMPRAIPPYDRARHARFVDQLIEAFRSAAPATLGASTPPVFICGMFRSGSTLVEQVLASHPKVTAGGELGFLPAMVQRDLAPFPAAMARADPTRLAELADGYLRALRGLFPQAIRITDKRPDNFLYIGLIKSLFPAAKVIHTTRDPLDNCLSVFFLHLDHSMSYALDLTDTAHYLREHDRLMAHWKSLYGADILDFDYDAFVAAPRPAVERLLKFCELEWNDACLSFHETKSTVKTASVWQVREPLYARSSGRWRNYARHLEPLRTLFGR